MGLCMGGEKRQLLLLITTSGCFLEEKFKRKQTKYLSKTSWIIGMEYTFLKKALSDAGQPNSVRNEEVASLNSLDFQCYSECNFMLTPMLGICCGFASYSSQNSSESRRSKNVFCLVAMSNIALAWKNEDMLIKQRNHLSIVFSFYFMASPKLSCFDFLPASPSSSIVRTSKLVFCNSCKWLVIVIRFLGRRP